MNNKFNDFAKAQKEVSKINTPATNTVGIVPKQKKETKEQMSIMLTPTHKKEIRKIADSANMSVSELIGYWVDQNRN